MKRLNLYLLKEYERISDLTFSEKYEDALVGIAKLLDDRSLDDDVRDAFTYFKAVILDNQGKTRDAVSLFAGIAERNPADITYAQSMDIVIQNLSRRATEELEGEVSLSAVQGYVRIFTEIYFVPLWLERKYCIQLASSGETTLAKARMEALLKLSPSDPDYLEVALEVGKAANDGPWTTNLNRRVHAIYERRPYDLKLRSLISPDS